MSNVQKLDVANIDGLTQLMWAAGQGHAETARFLVPKGANKSLKEKLELTALEIAKQAGHAQIAAILQ